MALGDGRRFRIKPKHFKHRAAALVEAGFGNAGFDALGDGGIAAALILHPHAPQRRSANRMGDHDAQRQRGLRRQCRPHCRVAVQVDCKGRGMGLLLADILELSLNSPFSARLRKFPSRNRGHDCLRYLRRDALYDRSADSDSK
jgi:hypothetical protein